MYIDTHTHFDMCMEESSITENEMMNDLVEFDIKHAIQVSTDVDGFNWSYEFAKRNKNICFSLGIHPSSKAADKELNTLTAFVEKIVKSNDRHLLFGIGETGLDYYRMRQPKDMQIKSFEYQIDIANKFGLPVIVHSREAMDDTINILKTKKPKTGIMHCFPGDRTSVKIFLDLGFYISFAGNLTYNKAANLHDAASYVPTNRILLETDAPFLTPAPLRGKKNKPEYIIHTYKFLAKLKNLDLDELKKSIDVNFQNLLQL